MGKREVAAELAGARGRKRRGKRFELVRGKAVDGRAPAAELEDVAGGGRELELAPVEELVGGALREPREPEAPEHRREADLHPGEDKAPAALLEEDVADPNEAPPGEIDHLRVEDVAAKQESVGAGAGPSTRVSPPTIRTPSQECEAARRPAPTRAASTGGCAAAGSTARSSSSPRAAPDPSATVRESTAVRRSTAASLRTRG
jgi:hypothetical protein